MPALLQRLVAWSCLAIANLTGLVPVQEYVLCIESDGCVAVEFKAPQSNCGGCVGHDECEESTPTATCPGDDEPCACIDLTVSGLPEELVPRPRPADLPLGPWFVASNAFRFQDLAPRVAPVRGPPLEVPRPPGILLQLRSIVLLV